MWIKRLVSAIVITGLIGVLWVTNAARPVLAFSVSDYFSYSYSFAFSKVNIVDSEPFTITVNGQAVCVQSLPASLSVSSASMVSKVVAHNRTTGADVVINPNFTLSYGSGFPKHKGDTANVNVDVPVSFPAGSAEGVYDISGVLLSANASIGINWDVTSYMPQSVFIGTVRLSLSSSVTPPPSTTTPTPPTTTTAATTTNTTTTAITPTTTTATTNTPTTTSTTTATTGGTPGITSLAGLIGPTGAFLEEVVAATADKSCALTIPEGTVGLDGSGKPLTEVSLVPVAEGPDSTAVFRFFGTFYEIGPGGATFNPAITISFSYAGMQFPGDTNENDIVLGYIDAQGKYNPLPTIVHADTKTVTAVTTHFTVFGLAVRAGVIGNPTNTTSISPTLPVQTTQSTGTGKPAAFTLTNLKVLPTEVASGNTVAITARLTNTGDLSGSYDAVLYVDGQVVNRQRVELIGKSNQTIGFTHQISIEGRHSIGIGSLSENVTVDPQQTTGLSFSDWIIFIIAGAAIGAVIVGGVMLFLNRKKPA